MSYETAAGVFGAGVVVLAGVLLFAGCVMLLVLLCCVCDAVVCIGPCGAGVTWSGVFSFSTSSVNVSFLGVHSGTFSSGVFIGLKMFCG